MPKKQTDADQVAQALLHLEAAQKILKNLNQARQNDELDGTLANAGDELSDISDTAKEIIEICESLEDFFEGIPYPEFFDFD